MSITAAESHAMKLLDLLRAAYATRFPQRDADRMCLSDDLLCLLDVLEPILDRKIDRLPPGMPEGYRLQPNVRPRNRKPNLSSDHEPPLE